MTDPETSEAGVTVRHALARGAEFLRSLGIEAARLEMELILAESMGIDRLGLYMKMDQALTAQQREQSRKMLARRREREPLAYILGHREFYGLRFDVNRNVLIPRPETEILVDRVLKWIREWDRTKEGPLLVDIGTGSGAIAVAAAHVQKTAELPGRWIATDISSAALEVARANAERHGVADRIEFRLGSLTEPLTAPADCICSNLPYVAETARESLAPEVSRWEPAGALFSGPEGLGHLKELIPSTPDFLNIGGVLFLEIGFGQREAVEIFLNSESRLGEITFTCDYAGIPRVAEAHRKE